MKTKVIKINACKFPIKNYHDMYLITFQFMINIEYNFMYKRKQIEKNKEEILKITE